MSDNTDLLRLFASLSLAIDKAEHKPGQWAETAQSMGGICCPGAPFDISKPWAKEEPWANFSFKRDSWLAVAAVNALPQLLALIAENERLAGDEQESADLCDCLSGLLRNTAIEVRGPEEPLKRHGFHDLPSRVKTVVAERDRIRAEVAGLRTGYEAYEQVNAELKAENVRIERNRDMWKGQVERQAEELTALRKRIDDMSPFKGAPFTGPDTKCLACGGYHYGMSGLPCPNMRITAQADLPETRSGQIGAALGQGEQS